MDEKEKLVCPKCFKEFASKSGHFYRHMKECQGTVPSDLPAYPDPDLLASQEAPVAGEPENPTNTIGEGEISQPAEADEAVEDLTRESSTETILTTEILPVPLTDTEYKEFGIKLGLANQEILQAEDELASVKSQYKARITSAEGRRNEYSSIINAGHQQKTVECHQVKDFTANTITVIRLDTMEVVGTPRAMTALERQRYLDFKDAP